MNNYLFTYRSVANQNAGFALVHWLGDTNINYCWYVPPQRCPSNQCLRIHCPPPCDVSKWTLQFPFKHNKGKLVSFKRSGRRAMRMEKRVRRRRRRTMKKNKTTRRTRRKRRQRRRRTTTTKKTSNNDNKTKKNIIKKKTKKKTNKKEDDEEQRQQWKQCIHSLMHFDVLHKWNKIYIKDITIISNYLSRAIKWSRWFFQSPAVCARKVKRNLSWKNINVH